ncbi:MAG: extracellular solute-binding protein, partial [Oscillospiraceae bacterium]|nr:extracellular solute-binding protein [Oscillospiraceae bacterium]
MRKGKALSLITAAAVCMSMGPALAGCGGDPGKVRLSFMGYNSESSRATYLRYLEAQLPDLEIEFEFVPVDEYTKVLTERLKDGRGPDIMELGGETRELANAGYLYDLTDQPFVKRYAQSGIAAYVSGGKVYATPLQSWYEGIFYNKAIFAENGVKVPRNLSDFIAAHKDLAGRGVKPQAMGAASWEPMMKQSIGLVNNEFYSRPENRGFDADFNDGKASLADAWLDAVTAWASVIEEGCLTPDMLEVGYDQALAEFASGKAAMWESGPWAVNDILRLNPDMEGSLGMFPIPGLKDGPGWLVGGPGSALAVNAKSRHLERALQVLDVTATPEAQHALIADIEGSSFLIGVSADLGPIYDDCKEALQAGNLYAPWVSAWEYGNAVVLAYGKALQEV